MEVERHRENRGMGKERMAIRERKGRRKGGGFIRCS
jgi:hypothetical protein